MMGFLLLIKRFITALLRSWKEPLTRVALFVNAISLLSATWFYHTIEGWSLLDGMYFSVSTITTVGSSVMAPQTASGKSFTILFMIVGVSSFVALCAQLAKGVYKTDLADGEHGFEEKG